MTAFDLGNLSQITDRPGATPFPAATQARPAIAPLDPAEALRRYQRSLAAMTDAQLTEERHRLEAQPPYGQAHRAADAEFEARLAIAHLTELELAR